MQEVIPLLNHPLDSPTSFTPETVTEAVRAERNLPIDSVPEVCILEFDGDLTDQLVTEGLALPFDAWPCFHTKMYVIETQWCKCGIVARTIGGPYAVLVAEQLAACGARVILGLTSAGRVSPEFPIPGVVVVNRAIRDEGTSYHYISADKEITGSQQVAEALEREVNTLGLPVRRGTVWTTDAPYRETAEQLMRYADAGVLAVEMQAASLFAFSVARGVPVGVIAHVTNAVDHIGDPFDKGLQNTDRLLLEAMCRAGADIVSAKHDQPVNNFAQKIVAQTKEGTTDVPYHETA